MSGLDKFIKTPSKVAKNEVGKDIQKGVKPKSRPKQEVKKESQKPDEEILVDDSTPSPPETDESETTSELQDLPPDELNQEEDLGVQHETPPHSLMFTKYQLKCTSKKCSYQRILMKSVLSSSDLICPKCGSQMRQKQT